MNVLLIGGSGNISPAIAAELISTGHDVTVFNRGHHRVEGARQIIGDRYEAKAFVQEMHRHTFDCVIDQICYTQTQAQDLVDAFAGRVRQLVFCSTVNTYIAPAPSYPVTENTPIGADPRFEYAYQKVLCEHLLSKAAADGAFHLTIVRPGATYNDQSTPISFVGDGRGLLYRIREGKPVIVLGDGSSLWGYAHRDDVGKAVAHAAGNEKACGQGYTIASMEVMTWEQIYTTIAEAMGVEPPEYVHVPYAVLDRLLNEECSWNALNFRFNNIYDCSKAAQDLDYRYTIPWREGARRILEAHRTIGDITAAYEHPRYDAMVQTIKAAYGTITLREGKA